MCQIMFNFMLDKSEIVIHRIVSQLTQCIRFEIGFDLDLNKSEGFYLEKMGKFSAIFRNVLTENGTCSWKGQLEKSEVRNF